MKFNFEQWIRDIQAKPESVRLRYVVACAGLAMLLVLGVWSLTVSESFRTVTAGADQAADVSQGLLPKASNFSLDALLSGEKSLEDRKKEVSGELFFQQQLEARGQTNFEEEGYVPKESDTAPPATDATGTPSR